MKKQSLAAIISLGSIIVFAEFGCSKESGYNSNPPPTPTTNCNSIDPSFSTDVSPLIQTKCAINSDCHATGSTNRGGAFTNYAQISAKASIISGQVSSGAMPKTGSITSGEKSTILCWINKGAANN